MVVLRKSCKVSKVSAILLSTFGTIVSLSFFTGFSVLMRFMMVIQRIFHNYFHNNGAIFIKSFPHFLDSLPKFLRLGLVLSLIHI